MPAIANGEYAIVPLSNETKQKLIQNVENPTLQVGIIIKSATMAYHEIREVVGTNFPINFEQHSETNYRTIDLIPMYYASGFYGNSAGTALSGDAYVKQPFPIKINQHVASSNYANYRVDASEGLVLKCNNNGFTSACNWDVEIRYTENVKNVNSQSIFWQKGYDCNYTVGQTFTMTTNATYAVSKRLSASQYSQVLCYASKAAVSGQAMRIVYVDSNETILKYDNGELGAGTAFDGYGCVSRIAPANTDGVYLRTRVSLVEDLVDDIKLDIIK